MTTSDWHIGDTRITKVHELDLNDFTATQLLPGFDPAILQEHPDWVDAQTYDASTGKVFLSVHTWVVRHRGKVILVDTGAGNDKDRPSLKVLDHLQLPFLERLAAVGVLPEQVDYVLLTHIHADHVGWNTRRDGEQWVPTFPNATVICSDREWRYGAALSASDATTVAAIREKAGLGEATRIPVAGVFADSMAPLEEAGKVRRVAIDAGEVLEGIRFLPTPGHSIDHAAIAVTTSAGEAVFGGDVVHHPLEWYEPDLVSMFCEFPEAARRSRRWLADYLVQSEARYFSSHFPTPSAGKVIRSGDGYRWEFFP